MTKRLFNTTVIATLATLAISTLVLLSNTAYSQEARARWERMCQIRAEKFDLIMPNAMQENNLDMWIVVMREGNLDPLWEALGRGYVTGWLIIFSLIKATKLNVQC